MSGLENQQAYCQLVVGWWIHCKVAFSSEKGLAFLNGKGGLRNKTCIKLQIATVVTVSSSL